jgi:pimeloyl-ACP methyl ester carboxylesterase
MKSYMSCIGKIKANANSLLIINIVFSFILIISISVMVAEGIFFDMIAVAYSNKLDQISSNLTTNPIDIKSIPSKKVHVGDIDIAYKIFGKGDPPILLINAYSFAMDSWDPNLLGKLAVNHTVVVFDNRGIGNTSSGGEKEFSIGLFANDTAGLLEALNIRKADVLGYSMGGVIAQELALHHPDSRVGKLIVYASFCGLEESVLPSQEVMSYFSNGTGTAEERIERLLPLLFPEEWRNENPNYLERIPKTMEIIPNKTLDQQIEAITSWAGVCDQLKNITQPTLVIVGTDDVLTPPADSLVITEQIPGAWLVQIKGAGHGLMYQYPEQFNKVLQTFLSTTTTPPS